MLRKKIQDTTYQTAQLKGPQKQKTSVVDARAVEVIKCSKNPLYFAQNYVYVEETGGRLKLTSDLVHNKVRRVIRSLYRYHKCVFMASRQLGKALDVSTPILRADGTWTIMGELKVGDKIFDDKGNPTEIIAATNLMYNHKCYKITFENGDEIVADGDHLWKINSVNLKNEMTLTTEAIKTLTDKVGADYFIYYNDGLKYRTHCNYDEPIYWANKVVDEKVEIPTTFLRCEINDRIIFLRTLMEQIGEVNDKECSIDTSERSPLFIKRFLEILAGLGIKYKRTKNKITFNTNKYVLFENSRKIHNQFTCAYKESKFINKLFITKIEETPTVPVRCIQVDSPSKLFLCGRSLIPTHNSTIAAIMIDWSMNFFTKIDCVILNMKKNAALKNLDRIKFIHENLPNWMRIPQTSKSDIKTYFTLKNNSKVEVYYPSTIHDPSTLARSLTIPILYIDEAAFISHMKKIYGSAQQTLSKAREQAIKNNYPYFIFVTSTPNGTYGDGEWFYKRYKNAIDSDEIFVQTFDGYENWRDEKLVQQKLLDSSKNSFIRVKFHWSEDPTKNQEWYEEQCRELDDERMVNQELDLIFVGSTNCIFSDKIISSFKSRNYKLINFPRDQVDMKIFKDELDPLDFYIVGVDTASSIAGAFNAIEIFSFKNFEQVGEINVKLGSLTKYAELVEDVFQWLYGKVGERIILAIENNSIGKAIIENILYKPIYNKFNYSPFIYKEKDKKEYGINTNTKTKELMVSLLYQEIKENPHIIKSEDLINQLSTIERSNRGTISSTSYSDMFMASCFCAFTRKQKSLDIMPLLSFTSQDLNNQFLEEVKSVAKFSDPKTKLKEEYLVNTDQKDVESTTTDPEIQMWIPFVDNSIDNDTSSDFFF